MNTVHVIPSSRGGWDVKSGGAKRAYRHFVLKRQAIIVARRVSKNKKAELIVHNKDGRIAWKDSHGYDPFPPRG